MKKVVGDGMLQRRFECEGWGRGWLGEGKKMG